MFERFPRRVVRALLFAAGVTACGERPAQPPPLPPRVVRSVVVATSPAPSTASSSEMDRPSRRAAMAASAPAVAEPPSEAGTMIDLPVPGFGAAVVAVPQGGPSPHTVVIAAHGNYDRPDWECDFWRRLFPESYLLCPRGVLRSDPPAPDDPRYTYDDDRALEAELDAAVAALGVRFGGRVDTDAMLWTGLSRGAFLGARIAARRPDRYPHLVLVEGGHDPWTVAAAKGFAERGGGHVQFVCGQRACTLSARKAAQRLAYFGVATRVDEVAGMGHGLNADVDPFVRAARPWLLALPRATSSPSPVPE